MVSENKTADVSFESLLKIFTVPEAPDSTLGHIENKLSQNLNQFLREHIVAEEKPLPTLKSNSLIPICPNSLSLYLNTHKAYWTT